jgi:hypothetical protein
MAVVLEYRGRRNNNEIQFAAAMEQTQRLDFRSPLQLIATRRCGSSATPAARPPNSGYSAWSALAYTRRN